MGEKPSTLKVVLDTNTVLSALLFERGRLIWIRKLWEERRITPLCSAATIDELLRALAYPKFELGEPEIKSLLESYLQYASVVSVADSASRRAPRCRDADDQKFLDLALEGGAEILVSGDQDLLVLTGEAPFVIESPARFRRRLETK
jgi:putative PIN family toxin of toxin-antitoxin system